MPDYLTDTKRIARAQKHLRARLEREAGPRRTYKVGFPGGDIDADVCYLATPKIWHALPVHGCHNRHWNGFGFGNPAESQKRLTLTVEINPSFSGSRRCAGLFFEDNRGHLCLGHTGGIGGGRPGVGKHNFLTFLEQRGFDDFVGDRDDILIGRVDGKDFIRRLTKFIALVREFKAEIENPPDVVSQDARVPDAARLAKYGGGGESKEHKRLKLHVAKNPEVLDLGGACRKYTEYGFITGDRVDVMFQLENGTHVVIEVELRGEHQTLVGAHQTVKYRALMAAQLGVALQEVKAVLVAHSIPKKTVAFCRQNGIITRIIPDDFHIRDRRNSDD